MNPEQYTGIIRFYTSHIKQGKTELENVPELFREEVRKELETMKGGEE